MLCLRYIIDNMLARTRYVLKTITQNEKMKKKKALLLKKDEKKEKARRQVIEARRYLSGSSQRPERCQWNPPRKKDRKEEKSMTRGSW